MLIRIIIAMVTFAGNSVLCRLALKGTHTDATSFSSLRLISGIIALFFPIAIISDSRKFELKWLNALLLCICVSPFSTAYVSPSTGAGALLFFGTVQPIMTIWGIAQGEELVTLKITGMLGALAEIAILLLPGAECSSLYVAIITVIARLAWAFYSITGKKITDVAAFTGGNSILSIPVVLTILLSSHFHLYADIYGLVLDVLSGAITSGGAYLLWYSLFPLLRSTTANTIQLSVLRLATLGEITFSGKTLTVRILLIGIIILAGIGLAIFSDMRRGSKQID